MKTDTTTSAPFSDWTTRFLLLGPAGAGNQPRDAATREEMKRAWGHTGEKAGPTWRAHETWLRQAAAERSIAPRFNGAFFSEALAKGR